MFRRSEKKIKAVFKMEFSASQVPQLKAKSLMISLVPVDVGKPTVRLPKSPIIEGTCIWESPVYETVKLIMETKTRRIREKFYYVIVSTGSSKSGFLGEVSIDFADLVEASKPVNLTLPLQTSKSGAVLHVMVQKTHGGVESRYDEDSEAPGDESYDQKLDPDNCGLRGLASIESDESSQVSPRDEQTGNLETDKVKTLERNLELTELEVQSLRKQIMKESIRGQQLSEQIARLREERDALRAQCDRIKSSSKNDELKERESVSSSLEKANQDLQREKQLNKKLKYQLQKSEDSNSEFVLGMRDLTKKLEQKNAEIAQLSKRIKDLCSGSEALEKSPETKASEDMSSNKRNNEEIEIMKQNIEDLNSEIEVYKEEKSKLQLEVERLLHDLESLETEYEQIYSKLEQSEKENADTQSKYEESLATVKQLKLRVSSLESENKRQARQCSESLDMIDELEFQVESLQKELENQGRTFGEDLKAITEEKVEQEQRATRAEEAIRKARSDNANTAERLQEEIEQVSAEMSLKLERKEKLAQKAMEEADELRRKNELLEEQLQVSEKQLEQTRERYEQILQERQKKESVTGSNKKSTKTEKETSFTGESEQMHDSKRWKLEKQDLESQLDAARTETEKLKNENAIMKSQIEQKKTKEDNLHLEVKKLRLKNNEVKNQLLALEMEKQDLKKEMSGVQQKLSKEREKAAMQKNITAPMKEKKAITASSEKEVMLAKDTSSKTKGGQVRGLDDLSVDSDDVSNLLSEVSSLKEKNKSMEEELKEMRDRYSEISLKFAEVEGERQQLVMAVRNLKGGKK